MQRNINDIYRARQAAKLAAKIEGRNRVNQAMRDFAPVVIEALRPWVGKQVLNTTGIIAEKVRRTLPKLDGATPAEPTAHLSAHSWGISLEITLCASKTVDGESSCSYESAQFYPVTIKERTIDAVCPFTPERYRTDYTEAEIEAARAELKAASEAVDSARSKLCGFGEHDNH